MAEFLLIMTEFDLNFCENGIGCFFLTGSCGDLKSKYAEFREFCERRVKTDMKTRLVESMLTMTVYV